MLLKFSLSLSWPSWPNNWGENGKHSNWHLINCYKILYSNFLAFPCETLGGLDVVSESTSSTRQKFEPLLQIDDLKSIQWSTKTCCLLSDIWKCKMCSWGGIAGRCMKARTANRAVRTYKKNKAKISSVSKSPLLSYHVLGLDGTLQEKVKSSDNFNLQLPRFHE